MKRFIVLTFAFLAWGYYEMSGGSDFRPETRATLSTASAPAESATPDRTELADAAPAAEAEPDIVVTRASASPLSLPSTGSEQAEDTALGSIPADEDAASAMEATGSEPTLSPEPRWTSAASAIEQAVMVATASSEPAEAATTEAASTTASTETVTVSGSRVNMRSGPGTDFGVVVTLPEGTEAELIEARDGWANIRVTQSGQTGWMAARLLDGI